MHDLKMHARVCDRITHLLATHTREPLALYKKLKQNMQKEE